MVYGLGCGDGCGNGCAPLPPAPCALYPHAGREACTLTPGMVRGVGMHVSMGMGMPARPSSVCRWPRGPRHRATVNSYGGGGFL